MTAWAERSNEWRNRYGGTATRRERAARERRSLREAICDLLEDMALTGEELAAAVREEWGECTEAQLATAIRELMYDDELRFDGERYALRGER